MSRFKTKSKQALTILLALLLFFAMVPSTLPGGLAYADEDTTFVELYTDSTATTTTDTYYVDDLAIYVRANCAEGDEYWPWIGIYKGALTPETWSSAQLANVWAYAEQPYGDQTNCYNTSTAFNFIQEGNYTKDANTDLNLTPGTYTIILFKDYNNYGPVAYKQFTIKEKTVWTNTSTEEWGLSISTDKAQYEEGEDIRYTIPDFSSSAHRAFGTDELWLGLYEYGADDGYQTSIKWEYINNDIEDNSLQEDLGYTFAPGKYHLILTTGAAGNDTGGIWATLDFTVGEYVEPSITLDKTDYVSQYKYGEPVLCTAQGSDPTLVVRLCDYDPTATYGFDNGHYATYKVQDETGSVDLIKLASDAGKPLEYGKKYRAYLCLMEGENSYNWINQARFELIETFGDPTWTWNNTFTKATATFTSKSDSAVTKTVEVTGTDITSEVTKEATEEEDGIRTYTATIAADKIDFVTENDPPFTGTATEAIPKLSHVHDIVKVPAVEATCETDGNIEYFKCTSASCNKYFEDAEGTKEITDKSTVVIPAKGHAWGEWKFDLETKTHSRVCANDPAHKETQDCNFTHQPSSDPDTDTELYTCTVCGGQYEQLTVPVITTDKTVYEVGEDITVTTEINGHTDGWVALYEKGSPYLTSMMWYYPHVNGYETKVLQTIDGKTDITNQNLGTFSWSEGPLPAGEYELVYVTYPENPYTRVGQPTYFTIVKGIKSEEVTKEPTCTETGIKHITYKDDTTEDVEIPALGHDPKEAWVHDAEKRTHYHECSRCDAHIDEAACTFDEGKVTKEATATEEGEMLYTCTVCGGTYTEVIPTLANQGVKRVYGDTRFQTALLQANELKEFLGLEKFPSIIVATGANYADALSGAYLGYVKGAPILLVQNSKSDVIADVNAYIKDNIAPGGTVYLLGGEAVVTEDVTKGLDVTTKRLSGATRYETNIEILKEAKVNKESILVCDGNNYADSLSASAAKLPILLVKGGLNDTQRDYLNTLPGNDYYLVGGTGVLPVALENELKSDFGAVERLGGADRYETSTKVAEKFFEKPEKAVVAYAMNYPDGLCGGTLAAYMNAPLLLVRDDKVAITEKYSKAAGIKSGVVLGGSTLVSDKSVRTIFEMEEADEIYVVNKMVPMTE